MRWSHILCLGSWTLWANSGTCIRERLCVVQCGRLAGFMKDGEVFLRQGLQLKSTEIRLAHHTSITNDKQDSHHSHLQSPFSMWTLVSHFPSPRDTSETELWVWPCFLSGLHEDQKHDGRGNMRQMQSALPGWRATFLLLLPSIPDEVRVWQWVRICLYSGFGYFSAGFFFFCLDFVQTNHSNALSSHLIS